MKLVSTVGVRANRNIVTVGAGVPVTECVQTGLASCHAIPCVKGCWPVILWCCCASLWDLHTTIMRLCLHAYEGCDGTASANPSAAITVQEMLNFVCWKVLDHSVYTLDLCDFIVYAPPCESAKSLYVWVGC